MSNYPKKSFLKLNNISNTKKKKINWKEFSKMESKSQKSDKKINWDGVVQQIFDMIGTNTAIINKYGIVLASRIPRLTPNKLISPILWEFIIKRESLAIELEIQNISNIILESEQENTIITFGENVYFMSKIPKSVDLNHYLASINRIISTLDESSDLPLKIDFIQLNIEKDYNKLIEDSEKEMKKERLPIFKKLIRYMAKK